MLITKTTKKDDFLAIDQNQDSNVILRVCLVDFVSRVFFVELFTVQLKWYLYMQFCQIQSEQGHHVPTFFSAWYLVCCILEFVLDKSKLPTISSKNFQLLIFERISCIHRTVSYSIRTEKEFNGSNFLHNLQKNYVDAASQNLSTKSIDTFSCSSKKIRSAA